MGEYVKIRVKTSDLVTFRGLVIECYSKLAGSQAITLSQEQLVEMMSIFYEYEDIRDLTKDELLKLYEDTNEILWNLENNRDESDESDDSTDEMYFSNSRSYYEFTDSQDKDLLKPPKRMKIEQPLVMYSTEAGCSNENRVSKRKLEESGDKTEIEAKKKKNIDDEYDITDDLVNLTIM